MASSSLVIVVQAAEELSITIPVADRKRGARSFNRRKGEPLAKVFSKLAKQCQTDEIYLYEENGTKFSPQALCGDAWPRAPPAS